MKYYTILKEFGMIEVTKSSKNRAELKNVLDPLLWVQVIPTVKIYSLLLVASFSSSFLVLENVYKQSQLFMMGLQNVCLIPIF